MPASVDSACVAGLLDLLRTCGIWRASVRYGYAFGALAESGNLCDHGNPASRLWTRAELDRVVTIFSDAWSRLVADAGCQSTCVPSHATDKSRSSKSDPSAKYAKNGDDLESNGKPTSKRSADELRAAMEEAMLQKARGSPPSLLGCKSTADAERLVESAVRGFFDQDLLAASRQLIGNATGSFGLVLSTSVDAKRELVLAARGQTMSIAFYPQLGCALFGSEAAATKAGLGVDGDEIDEDDLGEGTSKGWRSISPSKRVAPSSEQTSGASGGSSGGSMGGSSTSGSFSGRSWKRTRSMFMRRFGLEEGFRFDLDDVNGEVVLLRWGDHDPAHPPMVINARPNSRKLMPMTEVMTYGGKQRPKALYAANYLEGRFGPLHPFMQRTLRLGNNPLVEPIPPMGGADPVGRDLADVPDVLRRIQQDWNDPSHSLNRLTAFTLQQRLRKRLMAHEKGTHDGSLDLLISGCEVSLWVGEQFAADMHRAFPKLKIVCISANKLLGQLGQGFPTPQIGFSFHEQSHDLTESCVLLLSHSGGTFATLNACNLLKGCTSNIFCVTSEWDTQVARAVRTGKPGSANLYTEWKVASYIFTTFCGLRPAEPCSLTVAATHQLLTQLLLYLMYATRYYDKDHPLLGGSFFRMEEVQELESLNLNTLGNLAALASPDDPTRKQLVKQAKVWSAHILEGPIAWILSALYILATVTVGYTPLSAAALAIKFAITGVWGWGWGGTDGIAGGDAHADPLKYCVGLADAFLYAFLPWLMTVLLRLVQGRPWHHRVAGRALLIGDIPWVAQSLEAFVSKLFALSYSIASLSVSSGNPTDHLVHRHTHRVVRGGLLAVGRPDGRLNALATAENTVCLSVNQASSIQNMGVTCESLTLGHNPYKLSLSASAIFLPTTRKQFFSEWTLGSKLSRGVSAGAMLGLLSDASPMKRKDFVPDEERPKEQERIHQFDKIPPLTTEAFIGEWMLRDPELREEPNSTLMERQAFVQSLYEGRMASLERFVSFLICFHAMGKRVQDFWPRVSCGMLGYDMSRSHSIMRIATTASPVSGSEVRFKMLELAEDTRQKWAVKTLQVFFRLMKYERGLSEMERLKKENASLQMDMLRRQAELPKEKEGDAFLGLVTDAAQGTSAIAR